jgi:hypothetical protein
MVLPKVQRPVPETLRQAQTWDSVKSKYTGLGWCPQCAAQAAWGHQLGFSNVHDPCPGCMGLPTPDRRGGVRAERWATPEAQRVVTPRGSGPRRASAAPYQWEGNR